MNGLAILKNIAAFLVEVLLMVIFVPKTLYKILKDPAWVPQYILAESKNSTEYTDYVSPVLLYLIAALVPFVLFPAGKIFDTFLDLDELEKSLLSTETFIRGAIYMGIPLSVAFILAVCNKSGLLRASLEKYFFTQCYYLSPLLFVVQIRWILEISGLCIGDYGPHIFILPVLVATVVWLFVVELFYIKKEVAESYWKSFGIILLAFGLILLMTDSITFKKIPKSWFNNDWVLGLIPVLVISALYIIAILSSLKRKKR